MELIEKYLTSKERKVFNKVVENFKKELVEVGYNSEFLTKSEILAATSIRDARKSYFKMAQVIPKGHPLMMPFKQFILMGHATQSNIPLNLFEKAMESLLVKGIFNNIDFETGLTGISELDRV